MIELSCEYLSYGAFYCMFLSCHICHICSCHICSCMSHSSRTFVMSFQMHLTDKYSQLSSIIWTVWPNGWVFVYNLSGCGFESRHIHLNFKYRTCFEQGFPWHSGKYSVWTHSETYTWHDKNIQLIPLYNFSLQKSEHLWFSLFSNTTQKMKFPIKDFVSKCDQMRRKLRIWSYLLKKLLMKNFIFCAV